MPVAASLLGFDEARFLDFFAELFAFPLPRAVAFFRTVFFFAAMGRPVPLFSSLIRFHLYAQSIGETYRSAPGSTIDGD